MTRDLYIAIMVAAAKGTGLNLSPDEVFDLSCDAAVSTRALNGLSESEAGQAWDKINPRRKRNPANAYDGYAR